MFAPSLLALATFLFTGPQDLSTGTASPPAIGPAAAPAGSVSKGLAASDWSSIRAAYEAGRHKIFALNGVSGTERSWTARNPRQGLNTTFDERGFTTKPDAGSWSWGLELQGYGWGATNSVTKPRATSTDGGRLSRAWDTRLTEWYVNDSRGLEHGLTVASRPNSANAPLTVDLSIRGGLRAAVSPDGRNVTFTDAHSGSALNYNGLAVLDAAGKTVTAKWCPIGSNRLRLQVEDAHANYPLIIDPVVQQAYLKASDTGAGDFFGYAVAVSGDTVVVGAYGEDSNATGVNGNQADNSATNSGAAYIFVRSGGVWSQQAYLKAFNSEAYDYFGASVAISGDTVAIGAYAEASSASGVNSNHINNAFFSSGAVYVFTRSIDGAWRQEAFIKASNSGPLDFFGISVALSGDTLVVGANGEDSAATGVNGWEPDNQASRSGAAYVFTRSGSTWSQQAYLKASNTDMGDLFGSSVAVSGDTVVVGAYQEDSNATGVNGNQANNSLWSAGAAYVFVGSGGNWSQHAYLKASNTEAGDYFGWSVAVSGDTVVVGAWREGSNTTGVNGNQSDNSTLGGGAVYVFVRAHGVWSQQAYLKASNTPNSGIGDGFGGSVAISGDRVVVGAVGEDSSATDMNGNQADNSFMDSGAAYIFVRSSGAWSQQAYVKASNTGAEDYFGGSVAISGDTVVVGARQEDSNANGVNGNQTDNSAFNSGTAYIFDLDNNPGTSSYGTGTPGCAGAHALDVTHAPMIGSPHFGITCNNAPPSSLGLGILANAQDAAGSDPFGIGVLLHVNLFAASEIISLDFLSDASGNGLAAAPIPYAPALVGNTYYAMALWAWTACLLPPYNLSTSRGLAITLLVP
ncbi:MAG: FG-GAP repeat protein [Planctomycetes bacterium]|nr:FG-GAP repeat protein [Planctomycetota bacterium]